MSVGTLYTFPGQGYGKRVRAAAAVAGVQLDIPLCTFGETNKSPEYLAKFPHGKFPGFEGKDGLKLFESAAVARYVASLSHNSTVLGASPHDAALVDQWISFADNEVRVPMSNTLALVRGNAGAYVKPVDSYWRQRIIPALEVVEKHLHTCTFLVTERITLADITLATIVQSAFSTLVDATAREKLPNLVRWFETITNQPLLKEIFGETSYIETALQYQPPKKDAKETNPAKPSGVAGAVAAAAGAVQSAAAAAVTAAKPKKKQAEEDEEDEPLVPAEPKVKNPLDDLPKSTFNLEDWKRSYSNMDTKGSGGSIEWFYQHFDKEGFSIWRVDFKYNEELTQVFMSSNQIGGFFNRLEASRKYLFGSVGVLGTANNSIITGVLVCRGQDFQPVVDVAADWESYAYKRLEPETNPADKQFFEDALAWDLQIGDKKWADGKNFK
ncbi:EF1G-domain-containing protein [Dacryopinax primogenitus]|uniref:EF1G-domain-containing protein n=1 Tax=Dacryopinax primogenitus (strain DJM 731) TaxID=1858805 RepID=M5FNB5_DACPD|nr:EF1G-domain-containing protein [Dacryopinax primogenitus]EJT97155.1 EF1G-domain-containing protein [Dacryopinax primogenitus]